MELAEARAVQGGERWLGEGRGTGDLSHEEPYLQRLRRLIEEQYFPRPTGTGGSFGEILCHEIHQNGMTFIWLAQKWGLSLPTLGELIWDHCNRV